MNEDSVDEMDISNVANAKNLLVKLIQEQIDYQVPPTADKEHFLYLHVVYKGIEDYFSGDEETRNSAIRYFFRNVKGDNDIFNIHAALIGSDPDWIRYELKKADNFLPRMEEILKKVRGKHMTRREIQEIASTLKE